MAQQARRRHALVTGGAGFIGSHLVDRLLEEGWRVTVIDNFDPFYPRQFKEQNIASHHSHPGYRLVRGDIRDLEGMEAALTDTYDVIVHLAARPGVRPSLVDPLTCQEVNVRGTHNLLEFARKRGIEQFVFASSSSVYGANPRVPWHEDDAVLQPISPYAASKVSGELLGHVYSHLFGLRFIALRLFTVYGPRQRPDLAIHKFARLMLAGEPIPVYGDGTTSRDYTYIDDIVHGIRAAMDYTATRYEIINLGNNQTHSLNTLIGELEAVLGVKAKREYLPPQPGDVPQTWADITRAKELLGYRPQTDLTSGLVRFARWLRAQQPGS